MKKILLAGGACFAAAFAVSAYADAPVPATPVTPATAEPSVATPVAAKDLPEDNPIRIEFDESGRQLTAYFQNTSQARLKIYSVVRFDPEIAKPRRYFVGELTSSAIIDPVVFDIDDPSSVSDLVAILKRFVDEASKSGRLKTEMRARKVRLEASLSREETLLVEQQADAAVEKSVLAETRARIDALKKEILLAGEIGEMAKITGKLGVAKINPNRPAYEFVASFEPNKMLYLLTAGYSFTVSERDARYCLELLSKAKELKTRLVEHEAKRELLRREVDAFFSSKSE